MLNKLVTESGSTGISQWALGEPSQKTTQLGAERGGGTTNHTCVSIWPRGRGRMGNLSKGRDTSYHSSKIMFCKQRFYLK